MSSSEDADQMLRYPSSHSEALEPPTEWARLRGQCPVTKVVLPSGDQASLVTRYADVKEVLSDSRFTRQMDADDAARIADSDSGGVFSGELATAIPPSGEPHQRWRRMISKWFTAKRMNVLRPRMEAMADRLIDDMLADGHPADLKACLGFPLPVWVICDMLGVPETDRDRFAYWSDTLLNLTRYTQDELSASQAEFVAYMSGHVAAKREEPGEDLLSELITATDSEGERLPDMTLVATGQALLVAGHETTANMIVKMVAMLLDDRSRWERLLTDRSLVRSAVEESLRFDANSGFGVPRYVGEETELSGITLARGTTLVCSMASANRDESAFERADEMDLGRVPNPHVSFGAGSHSCLGQMLARTELQTVLDVLLRRIPTLELAVPVEELSRVDGLVVGGLRELPVRW
ncbi:cytochrome P450 [Nocardiopsis synnemataformans]|uniref:cytochrome P450 n=1 Tax=Nocardiopsis synnemataformans TaxID=61305 RepID=UPI003EB97152